MSGFTSGGGPCEWAGREKRNKIREFFDGVEQTCQKSSIDIFRWLARLPFFIRTIYQGIAGAVIFIASVPFFTSGRRILWWVALARVVARGRNPRQFNLPDRETPA